MPTDEGAYRLRPADETVDAAWLGLRDANLSGWYNGDTGEMFDGFAIGREDVVVDVGCGDGGPARFAAARGAEIIVTDIVAENVARSAERCRDAGARKVTALVSDSSPLPIEDARASRIICSEVLEHVEDPFLVMRELVRIGRPGALYLLTVPDPVGEELQRELAPPAYFVKPNHVRIFTRAGFENLVTRSGLVIERRDAYGFFWSMWWLLFWSSNVDLKDPRHPILDAWTQTWGHLLESENGLKAKRAFDHFMPKSQVIVARKPTRSPGPWRLLGRRTRQNLGRILGPQGSDGASSRLVCCRQAAGDRLQPDPV